MVPRPFQALQRPPPESKNSCGYADPHKDKQWQKYAAVIAAAYCKELLSVIPRNEERGLTRATALVKDFVAQWKSAGKSNPRIQWVCMLEISVVVVTRTLFAGIHSTEAILSVFHLQHRYQKHDLPRPS